MTEYGCQEGGCREDSQCGWRVRVVGCKSQETLVGGIMKPIVTTMLAHHAQVLVKGHYGFTSNQFHDHSLLEASSCDQGESELCVISPQVHRTCSCAL